MAQMQKPTNVPFVEQRPAQGNHQPTAPVQQQQTYPPAAGHQHVGVEEGRSSMVPYDNPTTPNNKLQQESRSGSNSPTTPDGQLIRRDGTRPPHNISPGERGSNLKAEAFADAHSKRVEAEAKAYIDAEVRKAEANAEKQKSVAEKERMKEEAKAIETLKKEEQRAENVIYDAKIKADKLVEQAKQKAVMMKAAAKEASERYIAEAVAAAERAKALADDSKEKRMAEIKDEAETMLASGEIISPTHHKSVTQKMKTALICH